MSAGEPQVSDEHLVERTLASHTEAFAELYERHRERVYRMAYRFAGNKADALDLCQEVFVKAYESLATFRGRARFSTWLTRIAANTCVDHIRQARIRHTGELEEESVKADFRVPGHREAAEPTQGLEREELGAALNAALARLSPEHRQVFLLHASESLTYEEIASVVGCPIGTVMSRLHYARKRLQGLLSWLKKE